MAFFARKIERVASDGDCGASVVSLIELAKKKGGRSIKFVIYRYAVRYFPRKSVEEFEIMWLDAQNTYEARKFWKFENIVSDKLEKTTDWLSDVAIDFKMNAWVRVHKPNPRKARRKVKVKRSLEVTNLGDVLVVKKETLRLLEEDLGVLESERNGILSRFEPGPKDPDLEVICCDMIIAKQKIDCEIVDVKIAELEQQIHDLEGEILRVVDELRFKYAKKIGETYWPRNYEGIVSAPKVLVGSLV